MNASEEAANTKAVADILNNPNPDKYIDYAGADGHTIKLTHNASAKNVSYAQVIKFIEEDRTNERPYIPGVYTCGDFAETVQHNAENAGIKCAWVSVNFTSGPGHACNAFNTTDEGIVYIDCTNGNSYSSDAIVNIIDGKQYKPKSISEHSNLIYQSMGIIKDHNVIW